MNLGPTNTAAIVLSGGAAYAAYEVGVVKALLAGDSPATDYLPLDPAVVVGTSAGALNATVLVAELERGARHAVEYLEAMWRERIADRPNSCGNGVYRLRGDVTRFVDPGCVRPHPLQPLAAASEDLLYLAKDTAERTLSFLSSRESPLRRLVQLVNLHTVFALDPFKSLLTSVVRPQAVLSSPRTLGILTTNWRTGLAEVFKNHDMTENRWMSILLASASIPGLPPVDVDGAPHADGAYVANTPIVPAIEYGADTLHVVYLDPDPSRLPVESIESTIGLMDKIYLLLVASAFNRDIHIVRDVNRGLQVLAGGARSKVHDLAMELSLTRSMAWIDSAAATGITLRPITLHRYRPRAYLGGLLGQMNFDDRRIASLIDLGYRDAVTHDCDESHCVFPDIFRIPSDVPTDRATASVV
jgi:predicted acylesterase/phospholipase RssA